MAEKGTPLRSVVAVAAACGALLALAGPAAAATTTHPGGGSGFDSGVEGWSASGISCTPAELLCTSEADHDASSGNPAGSIVVETTATLNLVSLFRGTATWTSPPFTVPVEAITDAKLRLDRGFDPGALVEVEPIASYAVTLEDLTAGTSTGVLVEQLEETDGFESVGAPTAVVGDHRYRLSIATETVQSTLAFSIISGTTSLGFDNVGLVVRSTDGAGADGDGKVGKGARRSLSDRRLFSLLRGRSALGPAVLKGKRLFVKVSCPAAIDRSCGVVAQGLLSHRKAATAKRVVRIGSGKGRRIALRVKPRARARLAKRKRLLVRQSVRAGEARATIYRHRKLIRR